MKKMPRNPFQERINALNAKNMDEDLKMSRLLSNPNDLSGKVQDVNQINFPRYSFPKANTLTPSELSMKDLIDELQIQPF